VAVTATLGAPPPEYHLTVWHGFNLPLLMSTVALIGGVLVYAGRRHLFARYERLPPLDANALFEGSVQAVSRLARALGDRLCSGSLQGYLAWLFGLVVLILAVVLVPMPMPLYGGRP